MFNKLSVISLLLISAASIQAQKPDQKLWQEAAALARAGQHSAALEKFQSALKPVKDQNLFRQAATILQQSGARDEHLKLYLWSRKTLKDNKVYARELAEVYTAELRYTEALPEWAAAFETQPDIARFKIEEIAPVFGYLPAARLLERSGGDKSDAWPSLLFRLYLKGNDFNRSREMYRRVADKNISGNLLRQLINTPGIPSDLSLDVVEEHISGSPPDKSDWQYKLAELYVQNDRPGKAEQAYRGMAGERARTELARLLLEQSHRPEEALAVIAVGQKSRTDSLNTEALFLKARCYIALELTDSARAIYSALGDSAMPLKVRQPALFQAGELALMDGELEGALAFYRQAALLGSDDDVVNDALARLLLITESKTDKMNILQKWARGFKLQNQFKYSQAEDFYRQVVQDDASGQLADLALNGLAGISLHNREFKKAAGYWGKIFIISKDSLLAAEACYQRGLLLRDRLSDPGEALKCWEEGIIKYPASSWAELMREELGRGKPANH